MLLQTPRRSSTVAKLTWFHHSLAVMPSAVAMYLQQFIQNTLFYFLKGTCQKKQHISEFSWASPAPTAKHFPACYALLVYGDCSWLSQREQGRVLPLSNLSPLCGLITSLACNIHYFASLPAGQWRGIHGHSHILVCLLLLPIFVNGNWCNMY